MKVLLILADGMRPDALNDIPEVSELMDNSSYTLQGRTVYPSVTLPCHMSLFHSVEPGRHGTTTNVYAPQVRPIQGLCEVLHANQKKCAFFYNWHELRDLARPGSLAYEKFISGRQATYLKAGQMLSDDAIRYIGDSAPDFAFLYFGGPDAAGHAYGWMGEEYMEVLKGTWKDIHRVIASLPEEYTVIVTTDHGGHGRCHGTELDEDMIIPVFLQGERFEKKKELTQVNILDIAPTIAALLETSPAPEWEGKSLV